jgi:hypothetical protein
MYMPYAYAQTICHDRKENNQKSIGKNYRRTRNLNVHNMIDFDVSMQECQKTIMKLLKDTIFLLPHQPSKSQVLHNIRPSHPRKRPI